MSVWTKVKSEVLHEGVDIDMFKESMKDLDVTLDFGITEIKNGYGKSKVNAMLKYKGKQTALGIIIGANKGITLVGDTWNSGIVKDKQADKLVNMMSQVYQKYRLKKELEMQGWDVVSVKKDNQIILECVQY